jgi:uncharacterized repeat protein (TIGR01451 family)
MKRTVLFILLVTLTIYCKAQVISGGYGYTVAICNDSSVRTWGANDFWQLGLGDTIERHFPTQIIGLNGIKSVSAGHSHTLALSNDSTVWAWGKNSNGQLGDGTNTHRITPIQIPGLSGVIAIAVGFAYSLALKSDGTVWSWGWNAFGQLGNGSTTDSNTPSQITFLSGIVSISTQQYHSVALRNDGTVWDWGDNQYGQLGNGTANNSSIPIQVSGISNVIAISGGGGHTLALKNNGTVWGWGWNGFGQLGDSTIFNRYNPVQVHNVNGATSIAAGFGHSFALTTSNSLWGWGENDFGCLGDGTNIHRTSPIQLSNLNGITFIDASWGFSIALKNDGTLWGVGFNDHGQLGNGNTLDANLPQQVLNLCYVGQPSIPYAHYIHGYTYADSTNDCIRQSAEQSIPFIPFVLSPGNYYSSANDSGYNTIGVNDSITYTLNPLVPQIYSYMISNPCPSNYSFYLTSSTPLDTSGFDFGFDGTPCWQLRVDISADVKRRCTSHHTYISYWNEGLVAANSVEVRVKFAEHDLPISSSMPYTIDTDSSLVFNIGTLQPWQHGTITIIDSIACISNITGLTQCTEAWILPVNQCLLDSTTGAGWDHSSLTVDGTCVNDTCRFVIENHGSGNMLTPQPYRIYANNVLVYTGSYQLLSGDSLVVLWVSNGATIRLEADQHPDHPGNSHPQASLEGCGTDGSGNFTIGEINNVPMDDEDVDVEIDCMEIRDSYDPNDKANSPEGIDAAHIILPNNPVDFTIRFQNTGTDTAYKVVIIDSLSNDLDLATLELGAASHAYTTSLSGQGVAVLKFTFNNINLLDSTADELNSHGFIKYKITPKSTVPLGTQINNAADIYFDYNFPVRTNTAFVTLGNYTVIGINEPGMTKAGSIIFYPNPTSSSITLETTRDNLIKTVIVYSADGRPVKTVFNSQLSTFNLDLKELNAGIYFLDCVGERGSQKVKVVKY